MMDDNDGFDQRFETDNFIIKLEKQHFGDKKTDVRSEAYISYKGNDITAYNTELKFTPRSLKINLEGACHGQNVDPDKYVEELKKLLLQKKADVKEVAGERKQYFKEQYNQDDDGTEQIINKVIKRIYKKRNDPDKDDPVIEDFADVKKFTELIEANNHLILTRAGEYLLLTNEAKDIAKQLLDIKDIEDIEEEAEKQLEEKPLKYFLDAIDEVHKGDEALKIWELVSALSAKCSDRQIHSWAVGPSGTGKSHIKRAIVKFLPDEAFKAPNSMSPKAMLYKTESEGYDVFKGKLLFLDEAEGYDDNDAVVLLRGLTDPDEDKFVHEMVKDQNHEELIIEKPVTVWFTSVESINDEQLKNRFILTNPDGSDELDNEVFKHQQKNLHRGQELGAPPAEAEVVKEMLKKIRKDTAGLTPIVPFQVEWKQKFNRRLYPYFVTLMEIIAKMNYKNRIIKENYIYVTRADFRTAATIWSALIDTTIAQTDLEALKLIMALPENEVESARTTELAQNLEGFNTDKVRRKAEALRDTEELQLINARKEGGQFEYWAGADKDLLVNPEPEIEANPETMKEILEDTEMGVDPIVMRSVTEAEIPVYDHLKQQQDEIKQEKLEEVNDYTRDQDLTNDEKKLLRFLEDMSFSVDLKFVTASFEKDEDETWEMLETLEDKGLIKIYEDDHGDAKPKKTRTYRKAREEGKITL